MKAYENPTNHSQRQAVSLPTASVSGPSPSFIERWVIKQLSTALENMVGSLAITLPSGFHKVFGQDAPHADIHIYNARSLMRLYAGGDNGLAEGYIAGEWQSQDLSALVRWGIENEKHIARFSKAQFVIQSLHNFYHKRRDNSRKGSRKNIAAHYDLGNNFYKHWLDASMTYSSGLYHKRDEPLAQAQHNKYQRILDLLSLQSGQSIAEIGCGWGGFAHQAASEQQLNVHGITLSKEQLSWGQEKIQRSQKDGVITQDQVQLSLVDYRDFEGQFDAVVSIEMFEAVGTAHWDSYFSQLKKWLKPGGRAVLQIITIEQARFKRYQKQADFIQRYVFPGGMLPSIPELHKRFKKHGFALKEQQLFGKDYAHTLRQWSEQFEGSWQDILNDDMGFDQRFYRLWQYYLAYCEGGFDSGAIDVGFYVLEHDDLTPS